MPLLDTHETSQLRRTIARVRQSVRESPADDPNEQSIKQGVILPILRDLAWPIDEPKIVFPEYPVPGGRVDYALCHRNHPVMLIEAKRYNRLDGAEWQIFQYAFHIGTPVAILTDGLEWRLFMPAEEGAYYERLLCTIKILDDDVEQTIGLLMKYLFYDDVISGRAVDCARSDYRNRPKVTESGRAGSQAEDIRVKLPSCKSNTVAKCGLIIEGKEYSARNRQEAAAILLNVLADKDPSILEKIAVLPGHGAKRKYLGKSINEIYPDDPAVAAQKTFQFREGWYIPANIGPKTLNRIVRLACEAGGLIEGKDIIVK